MLNEVSVQEMYPIGCSTFGARSNNAFHNYKGFFLLHAFTVLNVCNIIIVRSTLLL